MSTDYSEKQLSEMIMKTPHYISRSSGSQNALVVRQWVVVCHTHIHK